MRTTDARIATICACLLVTWCAVARGTQFLPPRACIYASPQGLRGFKVVPHSNNTQPRTGIFFSVAPDGRDKIIWKRKLISSPASADQILIHERANTVITFDNAYSSGYAHSMVIYGSKGQVVRDFALEDLLSKSEISQHIEPPDSRFSGPPSRCWRCRVASFILDSDRVKGRDAPNLEIIFGWGKHLKISLKNGRAKSWNSEPVKIIGEAPQVIVLPATGA